MGKEAIDYFRGNTLAASVWTNKYALRDSKGELLEKSPKDMHIRMASIFGYFVYDNIQKIKIPTDRLSTTGEEFIKNMQNMDLEELKNYIYSFFKDFKYIVPQGSVMAQMGSSSIGSLSNCFVIGSSYDSYGGILRNDEEQVQLMKRRGGVGQDVSGLRPNSAVVSNAAKTSSGPISFMRRFSHSTREVGQDGRRGALMLSMDIRHPDILEFIQCKRDEGEITGANISIGIRNEFMEEVQKKGDYVLRFPIDGGTVDTYKLDPQKIEYNQLYAINNRYFRYVKSKEIWDEIIKSAHQSAEPGVMFLNNHWDYSPDGVYEQFKGVTTNPCGEIFMQPYDACRLIALNLSSFVEKGKFNFNEFREATYMAMFLSDVLVDIEITHIDRIISKIELDDMPEDLKQVELNLWKKVRKTALSSRRTGLGFTAFGDMLAALEYPYTSNESFNLVKRVMKAKFRTELECSIDMSKMFGTFKGWDPRKEFIVDSSDNIIGGTNAFYEMIYKEFGDLATEMLYYGRRNVSWSTVNGGFM